MRERTLAWLVLLLAAAALLVDAGDKIAPGLPGSSPAKKQLKRSNAKRWEAIHDVVRAEIKSATRRFLEERARALVLPVEVDVLLIGFDGDGGYGYHVDKAALEELLGTATEDNTICPTVWETGETAAVCFSINYLMLDNTKAHAAMERIETALKHNMEWVGDRSQDWPDGSKEVQVYEVEASGEVEATVWDLLDEAYGGKQPEVNRDQHNQIVIINPSKMRMKAALPPAPYASSHPDTGHHTASAPDANANANMDFIGEWKKGGVNSSHVVEQEAGYLYRYRYNGLGSGAAFVGQYNFVLIDIAAGPVSYGPLASPSGAVAPTGMPRLMPMLLRMTRELEVHNQPGTLHAHMLEEAAKGQSAVFTGQLASTIAAATRQLFASDMVLAGAESLGGGAMGGSAPKRVAVPIVVFQDHVRDLEEEEGGRRAVDLDMVQLALDELLPPDIPGAVSISRHMLHHHKQLAAALVKARHSRSDAVLAEPPDVGLHRSQTVALDSGVFLRELRLLAAGDDLLAGLVDHIGDDYRDSLHYQEDPAEFIAKRRHETKVLPVFVFSLERSPEQMMFDNHDLVAAGTDVVAALQLLGNPVLDEYSRGRIYSGHMHEGHHLLIDAGDSPTRSIIAGLATALGGVVPAHQRYCPAEHAIVEDWRWAVGAVPWGPYSNYTALSSIFASTARRNLLVSRIEQPLRRLIATMDRVDAFIAAHLQGPFAGLKVTRSNFVERSFHDMMPHHHLLDDLARQHQSYRNASKPLLPAAARNLVSTVGSIAADAVKRAAAAKAGSPSGSSASPSGHSNNGRLHEAAAADHEREHAEQVEEKHYLAGDHVDDDDHYLHPHTPPPEGVEVIDNTGAGAGGHKKAAAADADLIKAQEVLSPNVAARLQMTLEDIGNKLESISYLMYSRNWAELEDSLPVLATAIEAFAAAVERDLRHGEEVVACCDVRHVPRGSGTWFVVGLLVVVLGAFFIAAFTVIRSQRLYNPRMGRSLSRGRSLSGSLPTWAGPGSPQGGLPR
ncbi:hypothetical protein HYH02_005487 [Chlamydomonas schloesseri]|uniref:DUF7906 domain-containing protein n=1 Tax=Chlamydomonas schloesseri TaxID=2026947 RepID=A0A836B6T7_9CHLO|nr:hypothetical protein HYH02_005487 [Chlamydomonas schloesseri]|eukprot:KAG2449332.1 hypothetical protein HYH02_005487 [Chlamydomonas schloesseri]